MIRLIEIYNLNRDDEDKAYINLEQISSIKQMEYGNTYMIVMSNSVIYKTDKESFDRIIEVIGVQ